MESAADGPPICSAPGAAPRPGQEVEFTVADLGQDGFGVGRVEGFVVLVRRGLPGDRVRVRITRAERNFAEAVIVARLGDGPDRVSAPCPVVEQCGGCPWMTLAPAAQRSAKRGMLVQALERIGGVCGDVVGDVLPSPSLLGYRNKIEFHFANGPRGLVVGLNSEGSAAIATDVDACLIGSGRIDDAARAVREALEGRGVRAAIRIPGAGRRGLEKPRGPAGGPVDEGGPLWNLAIREGRRTGDLLVNLVTTSGPIPREETLGQEIASGVPGLTGVVRTQTPRRRGLGRVTTRTLYGRSFVRERVGEFTYEIEAGAFFQVNTEGADLLYGEAVDAAALASGDSVLDLYCGVGGLSLPLASRAGRLLGLESAEESIHCARRNAAAAALAGATFEVGEARRAAAALAEKGTRFDVVCVNPPRSGLHPNIPRSLLALGPRGIVYVSCHPGTLARDVGVFASLGWRLARARPVDMFPHSPHLETVALLEPAS